MLTDAVEPKESGEHFNDCEVKDKHGPPNSVAAFRRHAWLCEGKAADEIQAALGWKKRRHRKRTIDAGDKMLMRNAFQSDGDQHARRIALSRQLMAQKSPTDDRVERIGAEQSLD